MSKSSDIRVLDLRCGRVKAAMHWILVHCQPEGVQPHMLNLLTRLKSNTRTQTHEFPELLSKMCKHAGISMCFLKLLGFFEQEKQTCLVVMPKGTCKDI